MKKNTKGFTLIELLAVIVILAIIALIATPIVLNLIEKARTGAAQDSAYGVRKAAQLYYQTALMEDVEGFAGDTITFSNGTYTSTVYATQDALEKAGFELDGTVPNSGTITIDNGGNITYSGIQFNKKYYCHATKGAKDNMTNSGAIYCDTTANS